MVRTILSVILGYLITALLVMTLYTVLLYALGTETTYKPGVWEPSNLWSVLSFVAGFIAAFAGGWAALRVARDARAATGLMALLAVLGVVSIALQSQAAPPTEPRPAEVSPMDAASKSVPPLWVSIGHILSGVAGVWAARRAVKL